MKRKAFTLAEIMIVLTVIGILSVILLPVAFNSTPDKNILKFKRSYNVFASVIRELVSSGEYYQPGNLVNYPDGTSARFDHDDYIATYDATKAEYFCKAMAQIMTIKSQNCVYDQAHDGMFAFDAETGSSAHLSYSLFSGTQTFEQDKNRASSFCMTRPKNYNYPYVKTTDGVYFYDGEPSYPFRKKSFKLICIDIDGPEGKIMPFGVAVRGDGTIYTSSRADWWLERDITKKETDCCPKTLSDNSLCDTDDIVCAE